MNVSLGSVEGAIVRFTGGSGYPESLGGSFYLTASSPLNSYSLPIISCCNDNNLTLKIPPLLNGTLLTISFRSRVSPTNPPTKTYLAQLSKTPIVEIISSTTVSQGFNTIRLNRTSTATSTVTSVWLVSLVDSTVRYIASSLSINGTVITITANLVSGGYRFEVFSSYGYYQCKSVLNV